MVRIRVERIGVLNDSLPQMTQVNCEGSPTVADLLTSLEHQYGPGIQAALFQQGALKPYIILLVNGRSIHTVPEGLDHHLSDGDAVSIGILVDGG